MSSLEKIREAASAAERQVLERRAERDFIRSELLSISKKADEAKTLSTELDDCSKLTQVFSGGIRSGVVTRFEELMTDAVRQVYSRDYTVTVEFEATKANSFWAEFYVTLPSGRKIKLSREGGGFRDVASVLARILYLMMDPSAPERFLVLDENMKNLDIWRAPLGYTFMFKVMKELGIQCLWITHNQSAIESGKEMGADRMYRFKLDHEEKTDVEIL